MKRLFEKHRFDAEVPELDREDEAHPLGKTVYYVNVGPRVSTDSLSEETFAADPDSIDSIQWHQKKSRSYG